MEGGEALGEPDIIEDAAKGISPKAPNLRLSKVEGWISRF